MIHRKLRKANFTIPANVEKAGHVLRSITYDPQRYKTLETRTIELYIRFNSMELFGRISDSLVNHIIYNNPPRSCIFTWETSFRCGVSFTLLNTTGHTQPFC